MRSSCDSLGRAGCQTIPIEVAALEAAPAQPAKAGFVSTDPHFYGGFGRRAPANPSSATGIKGPRAAVLRQRRDLLDDDIRKWKVPGIGGEQNGAMGLRRRADQRIGETQGHPGLPMFVAPHARTLSNRPRGGEV